MSPQVLQVLRWIRDPATTSDTFTKGYVIGFIHGRKDTWESWERQYVAVVAERVIWQGKRA